MKGSWALFLLVLAACGPQTSTHSSDAVAEPVEALAVDCRGSGSPTVVLDAGLGEASQDWTDVAGAVSDVTRVCTFDRPGYGESELGTLPRTPDRNAADLRTGLTTAGVQRPFVLVGHSLGGLNAQAYWKQYPDDLVGLVLLDPPPRGWLERRRFPGLWDMAVRAGEELRGAADEVAASDSPDAARLVTMASEHNSMLEVGAAAVAIESFGSLPLLVVAAERPNPAFGDSAVAYQAFWINESRTLASRSSRGRLHVLESTGHSMNREAPEAVTRLIFEFIQGL